MKIQFYTHEIHRETIPEPVPASKVFPEWYSSIELESRPLFEVDGNEITRPGGGSIKRCPGVQDIMKTGYILRSWEDFVFRESDNGELFINWLNDASCFETYCGFHDVEQTPNIPNKPLYHGYHKIPSPWMVKTDPGVSLMILDPYWHNKTNFTTVHGIIHSDVTPFIIQWFFEWTYKITTGMSSDIDEKNQLVKYGDPLMLLVPFRRESFEMDCNYVSETEWIRMQNVYRNNALDRVGSKCPYVKFRQTIGNLFR